MARPRRPVGRETPSAAGAVRQSAARDRGLDRQASQGIDSFLVFLVISRSSASTADASRGEFVRNLAKHATAGAALMSGSPVVCGRSAPTGS